ncbi:hypothetical protein ACSBR2_009052 [Camellia fascicularis]
MSISFEALAMSGTNYLEFGMDIEEWERLDSEVPSHLYADEQEEEEGEDRGPRKRGSLVLELVVFQMVMVMTIVMATTMMMMLMMELEEAIQTWVWGGYKNA